MTAPAPSPPPTSPTLSVADLSPQTLDAACDLLVAATTRRARLTGRCGEGEDAGLRTAARTLLASALDHEDRFALVATDARGVAGVTLGLVSRLTPQDQGYNYLPPRHTLIPQSGWAPRPGQEAQVLPDLWSATRARSQDLGLDRVTVQVLDADWTAISCWQALGLRPDTIFALRTTAAVRPERRPPLSLRPARLGDLDALVDLSLEEQMYHAHHTGSGMAVDQSRDTVTALCRDWLDHDAEEGVERAFVAETSDGAVVGVTTVHTMSLPSAGLGVRVLPRRYGYIGLTSVTEGWRGRGVGGSLADRALAWVQALPDPPAQTGLHYVVDNVTSASFWAARGYASVLTHLTDAPPLQA